jgi:hypothetical protein
MSQSKVVPKNAEHVGGDDSDEEVEDPRDPLPMLDDFGGYNEPVLLALHARRAVLLAEDAKEARPEGYKWDDPEETALFAEWYALPRKSKAKRVDTVQFTSRQAMVRFGSSNRNYSDYLKHDWKQDECYSYPLV